MKASENKSIISSKYLDALASTLNIDFPGDQNDVVLPIHSEKAFGHANFFSSGNYKWYTEININCHVDIKVPLLEDSLGLIHFIYCSKGSVTHELDGNKQMLNEFQTAIIYDKKLSYLSFTEGEEAKVVIISVAKPSSVLFSNIARDIHNLFEGKLVNEKFSYYGSSNLKISEEVAKINTTNKKGLVKKLYVESIIQMILAMEIQHHQKDLDSQNELYGVLTLREQKIVKEVAKEIRENCDYPFSIKYLMDQTGLSAAKLQDGFKMLYNRTVTDYVKNTRIEKAENLIKTTDLNISEIVYSIGFTSRSYFSKIFKEKYNCSPRHYQERSRDYSFSRIA